MRKRGRAAGACVKLLALVVLIIAVGDAFRWSCNSERAWRNSRKPLWNVSGTSRDFDEPEDITALAFPTSREEWHQTVQRSVNRAKDVLGTADRQHHVLIPVLSSYHERLCCFLSNLQKQVFPATPADVFVFSGGHAAEEAVAAACPERLLANVHYLPLDEHWLTPQAAGSPDGWAVVEDFSDDYRRMGHWRLTFQYAFADALGYRYIWQMDDDSHFNATVPFNVVEYLGRKKLQIAAHEVTEDPESVIWGLAELTRYFLLAEAIEPETLFNNCKPPSLEGLYVAKRIDPDRGYTNEDEEQDSGGEGEGGDNPEKGGQRGDSVRPQQRGSDRRRQRRLAAKSAAKQTMLLTRPHASRRDVAAPVLRLAAGSRDADTSSPWSESPEMADDRDDEDSDEEDQPDGWNGTVLYGNCILVNLNFWFREDVQKYLRLVLATAGHYRFRWNEQAVLAMVWQIFVPRTRFEELPIGYYHPAACNQQCDCWEDL